MTVEPRPGEKFRIQLVRKDDFKRGKIKEAYLVTITDETRESYLGWGTLVHYTYLVNDHWWAGDREKIVQRVKRTIENYLEKEYSKLDITVEF